MAEGIRVNQGWRRTALIKELDSSRILDLYRGVTPDMPELQTAFDVVCVECRDLLPCGSTLAVASGRSLERSAELAQLDRATFREMVRCLARSGVVQRLPGVSSKNNGYLLGIPSEYGVLGAYSYHVSDGVLRVHSRTAMHATHVDAVGVSGGVINGDVRTPPFSDEYARDTLREIRALYGLGLDMAPALVQAFGPGRCRQVRRWAARRLGKQINARLIFATLMKYRPRNGGDAFDVEALRGTMASNAALDEEYRVRHNI